MVSPVVTLANLEYITKSYLRGCSVPPLAPMPAITLSSTLLQPFGLQWATNGGCLSRMPPNSSMQLGVALNRCVAQPLSVMLGGIPVVSPANANSLLPPQPDCVEVGDIRIIGGIRPQNFDVGYRPDGVRFAFDSKTLNDRKSVGKNYQNMINDLATEAATVHTRFPYAIVAFMVVVPAPCLLEPQRSALTRSLEVLSRRMNVGDEAHLAESIALIVWDPETGAVDENVPDRNSSVSPRVFSDRIQTAYFLRYQGLPPHVV